MAPAVTLFTTFDVNMGFLDETVRSVLAQTFTDFEYLIINDGDPAESERLAREYPDPRIRIVTIPHEILAAKRQRGLELAQGRYFAVIDSDDVCEPARLEKQVAFLESHPDHVVVGSALRVIDEQSRTIGFRHYVEDDAAIRAQLVEVNCIANSATMSRTQALRDAGGYTTEFPCNEDYDLWLRVARLGKMHNLAEPLIAYRIHGRSLKSRKPKTGVYHAVRLKWTAVRRYGYRLTFRLALNIAAHVALLALPSRAIVSLFKRFAYAPAELPGVAVAMDDIRR